MTGEVGSIVIGQAACEELPLTVYGEGSQTRSFCTCFEHGGRADPIDEWRTILGRINVGNTG
jgi:hypothetical protein